MASRPARQALPIERGPPAGQQGRGALDEPEARADHRRVAAIFHQPGVEASVHAYPQTPQGWSDRLQLDLDDKPGKSWPLVLDAARKLAAVLAEDGAKPELVRSESGTGIHLCVPTSEPVTGAEVQAYGWSVVERAGYRAGDHPRGVVAGCIEVFPDGPGSTVALPLARNSERIDLNGRGFAAGPMTWSPVPAAIVREEAALARGQGGSVPGRLRGGKPGGGDEPPAHIVAEMERARQAGENPWEEWELPEPPPDLERIRSALDWFAEHGDGEVGDGPRKTSVGLRGRAAWRNIGMAMATQAVRWPEHADALHDMFDRASARAAQVSGAAHYDPGSTRSSGGTGSGGRRRGRLRAGSRWGRCSQGARQLGWQDPAKGADVIPIEAARTAQKGKGRQRTPEEVEVDREARLAQLDKEYIILENHPRAPVVHITYDEENNRSFTRMTFRQMAELLETEWTEKDGEPVPISKAWRHRHNRPQYQRMDLYPNVKCPLDVYNMWRGFGVAPKRGNFPYICHLLRDIYCNRDLKLFHHLFKLLAWKFQHLGEMAEVIVVLRGKQGTGKSTLARIIRRLLPHHVVEVTNAEHLSGKHNAHLHDKLFVLTHEAVYGNDKNTTGIINAMVTEPWLNIEPKFVDAFPARNRLMVIINSNEALDRAGGGRRPAEPRVGRERPARRGTVPFWDRFYAALDAELPAFLWALLNIDLTGFDRRSSPYTAARLDQQTSLASVAPAVVARMPNGGHDRRRERPGRWRVGWTTARQAWPAWSWPVSAPTHVLPRRIAPTGRRARPPGRGTGRAACSPGSCARRRSRPSGQSLVSKTRPRTGPARQPGAGRTSWARSAEHREAFARMLKVAVDDLFAD